jgi:hypothetical protein
MIENDAVFVVWPPVARAPPPVAQAEFFRRCRRGFFAPRRGEDRPAVTAERTGKRLSHREISSPGNHRRRLGLPGGAEGKVVQNLRDHYLSMPYAVDAASVCTSFVYQ